MPHSVYTKIFNMKLWESAREHVFVNEYYYLFYYATRAAQQKKIIQTYTNIKKEIMHDWSVKINFRTETSPIC